MDKHIFFMLGEKELILDKVLVAFNEAPIFFVCKSNKTYYIASCVDIEEERYYVTQTKLSNLSKMLHGKITMRDLILQAHTFWDIIVGEDFSKDITIEKNIEVIPLDELPYEGAYLTLATEDLKRYTEEIDALLYNEGNWANSITTQSYINSVDYLNLTKLINEHYTLALQRVYESIIKNLKEKFSKNEDWHVNSIELCNNKINICIQTSDMKVKIDNNDNLSLAA